MMSGLELEKKLPLAFIFLLLSQLVLGAWFVSKFDSRLSLLETQAPHIAEEMVKLETARESTILEQSKQSEKLDGVRAILEDLRSRSDRRNPEFTNDPSLNRSRQ